MSGFFKGALYGEPKQKDKQAVLNLFNRMTFDDFKTIVDKETENIGETVWILRGTVCNARSANAYTQLQNYRKYVPKLIDACFFYEAWADYAFEQMDRLLEGIDVNKNKRWEKEDEEALIEMVCNDANDIELAVRFGRSVSAIKTKVSQLVGIGRIDQKVAGRFIGTINGEEADAILDGKIFKR